MTTVEKNTLNKMTLKEKAEFMAECFPMRDVEPYMFFNLTANAFNTYFDLLVEGKDSEVMNLYYENAEFYVGN